ncbi:MAG: membrane protein insertase YidC [Deltaproteobacteria bacterium]|nr:membrane protein insertase YidC [Deltaproteobacteria bacterium]
MEDRRTAYAILICIIIVMLYTEVYLAPYTRQPLQQAPAATQTQQVANNQGTSLTQQSVENTTSSPTVVTPKREGVPTPADINAAEKFIVETKTIKATFVSLGARIESFELKTHRKELKGDQNYEMVSHIENTALPLGVYSGDVNDNFTNYKLESIEGLTQQGNVLRIASDKASLTFVGNLSDGREIRKTLTFYPDNYLFDLKVALSAPSKDGSRLWVEWSYFEPKLEERSRYDFHGFMKLSDRSTSTTNLNSMEDGQTDIGNDSWIGIGDKYFTATMIPAATGQNTKTLRRGEMFYQQVAGEPATGEFNLYVGPKVYDSLKASGHDLFKSIDLGFFSALAHPLLSLIRFFHSIFGNYGLAIILLTLIIKALFLPLTKKSFQSMGAMQNIQPKIKQLRDKYKSDPTKMNQELIALYKREGVNPMGGCLPMLIQLPVFLGLYNALLNSIELRHAPFALWIHDLSSPERLHVFGIAIPVMVILMGVSMFVQQWMTPSSMDPTQKKVMMFMPIMFTFFFLGFPSGLVIYWLTNNLVSILQQYYIRKERAADATKATVVASIAIFGFAYILVLTT